MGDLRSNQETPKNPDDSIRQVYRSMQDIVLERLKDEIFSGYLKPGDSLNTLQLSKRLGVSRTPIREALNHLTLIGLAENQPHKGCSVRKLSVEQIIELYFIRGALAGIAARLAVHNLNEEEKQHLSKLCDEMSALLEADEKEKMLRKNAQFHEIIQRAAQSPQLEMLITQFYTQSEQYRHLALELPGRYQEVCTEHRKILEAVQKGDGEAAEQYSREHHFNTARRIAKSIGKEITI
jgi:DNA-binding GntR family transcriptional regulator